MKGPLGDNDGDCEKQPHDPKNDPPDLHVPASRKMVTLLDEWKKREDRVTILQSQLKEAKEALRLSVNELGDVGVPRGFDHAIGFWHRFSDGTMLMNEVVVTVQKWNPGADPNAPNYMVRVFRGLS